MAAIFTAVKAFDVEALRRELAAGVDPDIHETGPYSATPLTYAVLTGIRTRIESGTRTWRVRKKFRKRLQERLECISVLLEAGASVDTLRGAELLHTIAGSKYPAYTAVIAALVEAGADVNFKRTASYGPGWHRSVLAHAAADGTAGAVRLLISAGAVDLDRALKFAIANGKQRSCTLLLRAGAAIPAGVFDATDRGPRQTRAYIERIRAAGGYKAYEKAHRQRLVAIFLPKLPHLPHLLLGRVLEFSYDVGSH